MSNSNAMQNFQLVKGVFSADDAREILLALIEHKISFHERNNWSRKERFGKAGGGNTRRINELVQTKADLAALIEECQTEGRQLTINCTIDVVCEPLATDLPDQRAS